MNRARNSFPSFHQVSTCFNILIPYIHGHKYICTSHRYAISQGWMSILHCLKIQLYQYRVGETCLDKTLHWAFGPICLRPSICLKFRLLKMYIFFFFKIFFFGCGPFLKSLLNLSQYCLFYVLVFCLQGMWDLSSPTRDQTCIPCIGRWSLNHWTTREVLKM